MQKPNLTKICRNVKTATVKHCKTCEYKDLEEKIDPCNDCLAEPMNANSDKPVYWKEAENGR